MALANSRVNAVAEISLQPLVFCPAHRGEKSPEPSLSALARRVLTAELASGKGGAAGLRGPISRIRRLTMPRAGRPEYTLVNAVSRPSGLFKAALCTGLVELS